jgi:hypothetical protein
MTDEMMSLRTLLEKSSDADLLREMVGFAAHRLMELEVESLTGAAHGERSPDRIMATSGYLSRARAAGVVWPLPEDLDDEQLEALLFPPPSARGTVIPRRPAVRLSICAPLSGSAAKATPRRKGRAVIPITSLPFGEHLRGSLVLR